MGGKDAATTDLRVSVANPSRKHEKGTRGSLGQTGPGMIPGRSGGSLLAGHVLEDPQAGFGSRHLVFQEAL